MASLVLKLPLRQYQHSVRATFYQPLASFCASTKRGHLKAAQIFAFAESLSLLLISHFEFADADTTR
jgi:hypothetical protein